MVHNIKEDDLPEGAEEVDFKNLREGDRIALQYQSSQSYNVVTYTGTVKEADRLGTRTTGIAFKRDNGREYDVNRNLRVHSTGEKNRRLSEGKGKIFLLESIEIERWDDEIVCGGLHIYREKDGVFDCPFCGAENSASVNSINENNVTVSCGSCREVQTMDEQPVEMALKVTR